MIQNRRTSPSRRCVPRLPLCKINFCRWHHGPLAMPRFLLFERRARTLARWIVPTRPDHINVREMTRGAKPLPGLCDPAHRTTSIDWLRKCGWFLPKQAKAPSRKGGHPRAGHTINPNLWAAIATQSSAKLPTPLAVIARTQRAIRSCIPVDHKPREAEGGTKILHPFIKVVRAVLHWGTRKSGERLNDQTNSRSANGITRIS